MSLDPQVAELLDRPNFVHVATLMKDGSPHSVAVWAGTVDGDKVAFFTQPGSLKARNVRRDGRVAMSVVDHDEPYRTAQLRGHLVEVREGEAALEVMDVFSVRHTGEPFPYRAGELYVFEVDWSRHTELAFERDTSKA
jgi:PPOX class probable F420-dependent enzyme